ncbi:MAG TPA: bifunctional riboflavin kinase/FAD synthetase [Steroidobacteraceae bacterium]|nr:bifunctional riboflavin kinase/FAD synthetase [Steroidobacteraceae bacterium]
MRLLRSLAPVHAGIAGTAGVRGYVATVGAFDGIHLGHRVLIERTRLLAREAGLASMVLSFEPLPKEYFSPESPVARLTTFRERWRVLERDGPEVFCVLPFNARLRALRADQFAALMAGAGVRHLVIGHDFRAAYRGEADAAWFQQHGPSLGLAVDVVSPVRAQDLRVSSGVIRDALARGDLPQAAQLLGRPYSMIGRVVRGRQLGRTLGYPTANVRLARRRPPMEGIFAVRVRGVGSRPLPGVASLGTRPTVGGTHLLLEAHVFDFAGDLYGREIEVEFVARLREERRFDTVDAMVEQIHRDAAEARAVLEE